MDLKIQELGGYGVFRFLDNLFNAFEALFEDSFEEEEAKILKNTKSISQVTEKNDFKNILQKHVT